MIKMYNNCPLKLKKLIKHIAKNKKNDFPFVFNYGKFVVTFWTFDLPLEFD